MEERLQERKVQEDEGYSGKSHGKNTKEAKEGGGDRKGTDGEEEEEEDDGDDDFWGKDDKGDPLVLFVY